MLPWHRPHRTHPTGLSTGFPVLLLAVPVPPHGSSERNVSHRKQELRERVIKVLLAPFFLQILLAPFKTFVAEYKK